MSREDILLEFIPEALELIQESEGIILEIEEIGINGANYDNTLIHNLFRYFHTIKGSSGLLKLETVVKLTHEAETLLDILRKELTCPNLEISQVLINTCDHLRLLFQNIESTKSDPILDNETLSLIQFLQNQIEILKSKPETKKKKPAFEIFDTEGEIDLNLIKVNINNPLQLEALSFSSNSTPENFLPESNKGIISVTRSSKKEIKVANEKLDALMDIMGELVIAESNVTQHIATKGIKDGSFPQALNQLRKIVSDLQEVVLSTRMTSISGVFQRMSRLIRDLQKKSNKKISLIIQGEETQIDKSVVDLIADPIIHILRNSVDHGIESTDERRLAGKTETGSIYLSARQSVNEVWIIIRDDGKGLNREKILNKAIEKGLFKEDATTLTDKEIFQMIFLPGLSTAREITDISGRGVGMDIVKQNIEKLGGKIDIHSIPGEGTTFILRIPLTLGIMEGTVVRIGTSFFTIQTIELKEFVGLRGKSPIKLEEEKEVYDIRGKFIPVLNMNQILKHRIPLKYDGKDQLMVVIEFEDKLIGIQVDEVMGNHNVVIKPLEGQMEDATHVSGFTILGTGNVSLILDVRSIFRRFQGTL